MTTENKIPDNFVSIPIADLIKASWNYKTDDPAKAKILKANIQRNGQIENILVRDIGDKFEVVNGNHRLDAMIELGIPEAICYNLGGISDEQAYRIAVETNETRFDSDPDKLGALLSGLMDSFDVSELLETIPFSVDDIEGMIPETTPEEGLTGEDDVPEVTEKTVCMLGDIWVLGNHRLMCGDSTDAGSVALLMNGEKADMVFTDPPYGILYSSSKFDGNTKGVTNKRNNAPMIIGDEKDFDPSFLLKLFASTKEIFIWGMQYYPHKLGRGGVICWNKKLETEIDCPHGDFELCWSKTERNKMCWIRWGGFNNKEHGEGRLHTTQKPVALAEWFFENWGNKKNLIADLFIGSGSTIIACEKTNRKCYGMELDPKYCDVTIKRWQDFTGKKAIHENGSTFEDISKKRLGGQIDRIQ